MPHILCSVATKGRYGTTLAACLQAIISQNRKPDKFILIDDNPEGIRKDLRKDTVLGPLLAVLHSSCPEGCIVQKGPGKGPHTNHELARTAAKELVWRVDDDECPMPDVLERLEAFFKGKGSSKTGASCGCVHGTRVVENPYADSSIPGFRGRKTVQWFKWPKGTVIDNLAHIHSTYLYRAKAGQFPQNLSPVGHTEETWHTVSMKMMGYKLYFDADAVTYHYRQPSGGIRQDSTGKMWQHDEELFNRYLDSLPVDWTMPVDFFAKQGVGDAFALRKALNTILPAYEKAGMEKRIFMRQDLMPVFEDLKEQFDLFLPIEKADLFYSTDHWNIYHHMSMVKWKGGLDNAYIDYYCNKERTGK